MTGGAEPDRWARWLLGGRESGATDEQRTRNAAFLERVRDRVLDGARITPGDRVLDIGAGTGLVATGAARRLGSAGDVVALDISFDALTRCRSDAGPVRCSVGDAVALPFVDRSFDVAVLRSVLIYVDDKRAAATELHRVLRAGGRVSLFEPVNAAGRLLGLGGDDELPEPVREQHARVTDAFRALSPHWEPMTGFDERDLVRSFVAAGFQAVGVDYELLVSRQSAGRVEVERGFEVRGNPTAPTWREAAEAALGGGATEYLDALAAARAGRRHTAVTASVLLTATA